MCLFTSARTVEIVFARSAGGEAMYWGWGLTFDGGFMDSASSRTECITEHLKASQRQGLRVSLESWPCASTESFFVLAVITGSEGGGRLLRFMAHGCIA